MDADTLRAALAGRIDPVPVTRAYRLGLLLVAVATVLLPVVYLGVIALTGWGVYLHAVHDVWILGGGNTIGRLILYLGPIVAGAVVIFFLLKPLLARPAVRHVDVEVGPAEQPVLFELISGVCRVVGAPMPTRVTVDCQVNASASFRRGLASFLGRDLQLTIGLPLVAGMELRQLAGVLAHEMGHFAQGSGMRLTYLVRSVNGWLARVVYERDEWDHKLADLSREADLRIGAVLWVARFGVWLSRKVLWLLMTLGHAIGSLMLRQMEYDADRYEARLAGSHVFATTALRIRVLTVGRMKAIEALSAAYLERRLADDFPALVASAAERLPDEVRRQLEDPASLSTGGVFDTHPPDQARIESAQRERAAGLFRLEAPAAGVMCAAVELARRATKVFYENEQEIDLRALTLVPTAEIVSREATREQDDAARRRYFGDLVSPAQPLSLPGLPPAAAAPDARALLRRSLTELEELRVAAGGAAEPGPEVLAPARAALERRLIAALSLLPSPEVAAGLPDGAACARDVASILRALDALGAQAASVAALETGHETITPLLTEDVSGAEAQRRYEQALPHLVALRRELDGLLQALTTVPYPFDHAGGELSLGAFVASDLAQQVNDISAYVRAGQALGRLHSFHRRALGRLASIAEQVEAAAL